MVPFAGLQSNITVLAKQHLGWLPAEASKLFLVVGVVNVTVQGLVLPRLRACSERFLVVLGLFTMMAAFGLVEVAYRYSSSAVLYSAIAIFALGNSLHGPALTSWISSLGDADQQGGLQAAHQSVQALARVVGPLLGGWAYQQISPASPYQAGLVVFLLALLSLRFAAQRPSEIFQGDPVSSK
jgi:DHA1 family tetracycline resistance protein-like MFS transporter